MKRIFGVLALMAVLLNVSAYEKKNAAVSEDDYVFKIGITLNSLCIAPLYVAMEKGYYDEEGLKWEAIQLRDGDAINLLTNGGVDGLMTLVIGLIQPLANGLPAQIPLAVHTGCIKTLVRGDSDIKTVADLKGKKIGGGGPSAAAILFTKHYLSDKGFKVDGENADFEFIYQSAAELQMSLKRGDIDAIAITDPAAQIAQDINGFRVIIDSATDEGYKDEFCCVVPVRAETIKAHPVATAKFLRALQKAAKFVQENPDETARFLVDTKRVTDDSLVNGRVLKSLSYKASVSKVLPALERNVKAMQTLGVIKPDVDIDKLVKDVYVVVPGVPDSLF